MASCPVIIVSYGGREGAFSIGVKPEIELNDVEIDKASENLWKAIRNSFNLPPETRLTIYEAESNRLLTKEALRDPSYIPHFPKYWYLTVDRSHKHTTTSYNDQFLSGEDNYPLMDCSDLTDLLLMEDYQLPLHHANDSDEDDSFLYPSLVELSMGQSPIDDTRDELMTTSITCEKEGHFGFLLRHFTVIARVLHSDHSSSESSSSRSDSRGSTYSSEDSYETLMMSTLFVRSVTPKGPAESAGIQTGDVIYSINGNGINGCTTDEIISIIDESSPTMTLCMTPYDELLSLYPKYSQGEPGTYSQNGPERITVIDIVAKTKNPLSPIQSDLNHSKTRRHRPFSADTHLTHTTMQSQPYLPLPARNASSINSLSSGNGSSDDLLISASLADIPIEPSPLLQRRQIKGSSLDEGSDPSQEWMSQESQERNEIEWFPGADDDDRRDFTYSLPVNNYKNDNSSSISQSGDYSNSIVQPRESKKNNKFTQRLKQTIKNLKNGGTNSSTNSSNSNSHLKLAKSSSLGVVQTCSTSALDRMQTNRIDNNERSKSTDLGRINKIKDLSLEALTKVNSVDNVSTSRHGGTIKQRSFDSSYEGVSSPTKPTSLDISLSPAKPQYREQDERTSPRLSQERDLSGESNGSGLITSRGRGGVGKSYRSQRRYLHQQTKYSPKTYLKRQENHGNSQASPPVEYRSLAAQTRKVSNPNDYVSFSRMGADRRQRTSSHYKHEPTSPTEYSTTQTSHGYSSQDRYHSASAFFDSAIDKTSITRSHSFNESSDERLTDKFTMSVDLSAQQRRQQQQQQQQTTTNKLPVRKTVSVHPTGNINNGIPKDNNKPVGQLKKFNSVFHGPINKKQERGLAGRKPTEKSWRSIYAAIQSHWMVFYNTVQDMLTGQPLASEPSLNLHHCVVTVLPRKKNVFRLTFADGSECLIQAENEESMMRWMRIIHNLNRMRQRLGPLPPQLQNQRASTQEATQKPPKEKMRRVYTPQPMKSRSNGDKDESSRKVFIDKLKRTLQGRQANGSVSKDSPDGLAMIINTFGVPLEECPASYDNKSVPLIVMLCLKELEDNWLDTEGLFRVTGPMGQVRVLAEELNKGQFELLRGHNDPHVLTGILKKFLKELPNPLIPRDKYEIFISTARERDLSIRTSKIKKLIEDLPLSHYHTLAVLIRHLIKIEAHSKSNKMTKRNLCIVFGPTLVRMGTNEENATLVTDMNHTYTVIETLMNNVNDFFTPLSPSVDVFNDGDLSPPQGYSQGGGSLRRGVSDPLCSINNVGGGSLNKINRRSFDDYNTKSLLSMNTQDMSLTDYNSQSDLRTSRPHKRTRLARSRHHLTSHEEEPQKDLSSPRNNYHAFSPPPPPAPSSSSHVRNRKISYNAAISDAPCLSSGSGMGDEEDLLNSHNHLPNHVKSRFNQNHRWSADITTTAPLSSTTSRVLDTEIVGPSSTDWATTSWTAKGSNITSSLSSLITRYGHSASESRL